MNAIRCPECGNLLPLDPKAATVDCGDCGRRYRLRPAPKQGQSSTGGGPAPGKTKKAGVRGGQVRQGPRLAQRTAPRRSRQRTDGGQEEDAPETAPDRVRQELLAMLLAVAGGVLLVVALFFVLAGVAGLFTPEEWEPEVLRAQHAGMLEETQQLQQQVVDREYELRELREELAQSERLTGILKRRIGSLNDTLTSLRREAEPPSEPSRSSRDPTQVIAQAERSVLVIRTNLGSGSGFVVSPTQAVTNYHVVRGSSELRAEMQVREGKGRVTLRGARISSVHPGHDLAVIDLPPVPSEVAVDGSFPVLQLRIDPPARTGESVFAIGNPGYKGTTLDYSASEGIVSSTEERLGFAEVLQTTVSVNPGNSGGPLIDSQGEVLGVVTSKGKNLEGISWAVPAKILKGFLSVADREPFRVEGSLEEWELVHDPLASLRRRFSREPSASGVKIPGQVERLLHSSSSDRLYLQLTPGERIQEVRTDTERLGRSIRLEGELRGQALDSSGANLFLLLSASQPGKNKLVHVDIKSMDRKGEVELGFEARGIFCLDPSGEWLVATRDHSATLLSTRSLQVARPVPFPYSPGLLRDLASNERWIAWMEQQDEGSPLLLRVLPQSARRDLVRLSQRLSDSVVNRLRAKEKRHEVAGARADSPLPRILLVGDMLIWGRRLFDLNRDLETFDLFQENPLSQMIQAAGGKTAQVATFLNDIVSVSPEGRWAASATHVYSTETRKIVKRLPTLTPLSAFSADGKTLYLIDNMSYLLVTLADWEKNAPDPRSR